MSSIGTRATGTFVRLMTCDDLPAVAVLHCSAFPGQLLTLIGPRLIRRFYGQFIILPGSFAFAASRDGLLVGFVAGSTDKNELFRRFYRSNLLWIGLKVIVSPAIWSLMSRNVSGRRSHFKRLLQSLSRKKSEHSDAEQTVTDSRIPNRLMSIAVSEPCRGQGIAEELVDRFCKQLSDEGFEEVGLSVLAKNERAIRFYEKTGWLRELTTDTSIYYYNRTRQG